MAAQSPGALNAMGLIDEVNHLILALYRQRRDPRAILDALPTMGWDNVGFMSVGKYFHLHIDAPDLDAALEQAREMGERFLSNPVIERFDIRDAYVAAPDGSRDPGAKDKWNSHSYRGSVTKVAIPADTNTLAAYTTQVREDALVPRHWGGRRMRRPYRNL